MVEETVYTSKVKSRATRPKLVYMWTVADVQKWVRRHCADFYTLYGDQLQQHDITGRVLVRLNENKLIRIGVNEAHLREELLREVLKLRLKTDILEIRDMQRKQILYE